MSPRRRRDPRSVDRISRRAGAALIVGSLATTGLAVAVNQRADGSVAPGWAIGACVGLVAIGLLALTGFRRWLYLFAGAASAVGAIVATATTVTPSDRATSAMVAAAITMTVGLCLDSILLSLHTVTAAEATQWERSDEALRLTQLARVRADEALAVSRELHNRVANTLHAISRKYSASAEQVRQRCVTDLAHFEALRSHDGSERGRGTTADLLAEVRTHCDHLGLTLTARCDLPTEEIPYYTHVRATVIEALTNTAKHSTATDAELTVERQAKGLTIRISDRGEGWRADRNQGSGMTSAFAAATVSGPTVSVSSKISGGLTVTVEVPRSEDVDHVQHATTTAELAVHSESTIPVARSLAFWLLGLAGVLTVVLWKYFPPQWWIVVILLGTCLPMTLINLGAARRSVTDVQKLLVAGSVGILVAMPIAEGPVASENASLLLAGCIPASVAVLLTAWLWTSRQWAFVQGAMFAGLGVVFWWAATASPDLDNLEVCAAFATLTAGLTLVLSVGLRALRRETSEHDASLLSVLRQTIRTIATSESERNRSQVRKRILEAVDDDVVAVLTEIANGTVDISNPTSIARIEAHESDLRSVIAVASHPGELGEYLMPLVANARNNGRSLAIHGLTADIAPESEITMQFANDLDRAIAAANPDSKIGIACYSTAQGQGIFLQLTDMPETDFSTPETDAPRSVSIAPGFTVVEYRWVSAPTDDARTRPRVLSE